MSNLVENDPVLAAIVDELCNTQNCHTVILYGSRAKNTHTANSDYDILAIRKLGESFRDARLWNGIYLDIFIYKEQDILDIDASFVRILDGIVLLEREGFGHRLLAQAEEIFKAGPMRLSSAEIELRYSWSHKMLERIYQDDIEANYRRAWLLFTLLEDYFAIRQKWYLGSKASWSWLLSFDPNAYSAFSAALQPGASVDSIASLVGTVFTLNQSVDREVSHQ
jgi:uncharacterized protein